MLEDEVRLAAYQRREYDLHISYGATVSITDVELAPWMRNRINEIMELARSAGKLVNTALPLALGPPGEAASDREIIFVARQLAKIYRAVIEWSQTIRRSRTTDSDLQMAIGELSTFGSDIIEKIGSFGPMINGQLSAALADLEMNPLGAGESTRVLDLLLVFEGPDVERFCQVMSQAFQKRGFDF